MDANTHHERWSSNHYEWLPTKSEIPKNLGEEVSDEHLSNLELDSALRNTYEYLQKFAVALEQVVLDQEENGEFRQEFNETEVKLRALLCEIQVALIERNVRQKPDVPRSLMTKDIRKMNNTYRNLRDWLIFRDYMNGLEYVIQVFKFLSKNIPS